MPAITAENLSKTYKVYKKRPGLLGALKGLVHRRYEPVEAVVGVSFAIEPGEIVGFVGPNGAGKTTTLKMLSGLIRPSAGSASVLGHIPWRRENEYRRKFSLVMGHKNQLWWDLPARDSFILNREIYDIPARDYHGTLEELTVLLQVKEKLAVPVRELSLGERMKMELIAALLHGPQVLFLDEPTIGLDVVTQANIRQCLRAYNERKNVTIILTSHYLKDIENLCPRLIVINHGRIIYDGSLKGIIESFSSHKLINVRFSNGQATDTLDEVAPIVRRQPGEVTFEVGRDQVTSVAQRLLSQFNVEDISIVEPPIEDVIAEVFQSQAERVDETEPSG